MKEQSRFKQLLAKTAHLQTKHPVAVLIFLIAITALLAVPAQSVQTVASLEAMMPADEPAIAAFNQLRDQGMGRDVIAIILRVNKDSIQERSQVTGQDTDQYVQTITQLLEGQTSVVQVQNHLQGQPEQYISEDQTELLILAYTDAAGDDARMKRLASYAREAASEGVPAGTKSYITGTPIIQQDLGELIQSDQQRTRWASTILVLIITALLFGLTSSIIPIITVTLSVSWLYGTMGLVGLPISTLAGGVAAMVIGIGIDFAIHLMNKFKHERKQGLNIEDAIEQAVVHTGTALTVTAITTGAAFLSFLFGVMPEMGRFGILMAMGIGYALVLSLVGLPALLVLEERIINWWSRRARFGIEAEYHLEKNK